MADENGQLPDQLKILKQAYSEFFSTTNGKIVLADLKRIAFFNQSTINESPHIMAFNEGQRAVVVHIINRTRLDHVMIETEKES